MKFYLILTILVIFCYSKSLLAQQKEDILMEATELIRDGQYGKALKNLNKIIKEKGDFAEAFLKRGQVYYELNDYNKMINDCEKTLQINPLLIQAHFNLGIAYYNLKNYNQSINHFNSFLQSKPQDNEALGWRGMSKFYLQQKKQACEDWEKAIDYGNNYVRPFYNKYCVEENATQERD